MQRRMSADGSREFFSVLLAVLFASQVSSCGGKEGSFGGQETVLKLSRMSFPVRIYEGRKTLPRRRPLRLGRWGLEGV